MLKIHIDETKSTNSLMLDSLNNGEEIADGTLFYTMRQTAGRGQIGNSWESEADKNIAFSMLLRPTFLPIRHQFMISEITCISILEALNDLGVKNLSIKWPNDIYCNDDKICGILIENSLMGSTFNYCVVGVGININQEKWIGNAPNPTSVKLKTGKECDPETVLDKVTGNIWKYYTLLSSIDAGVYGAMSEMIHKKYLNYIYRKEGFHPYKDAESGKEFMAQIKTIEPSGYLHLEDTEGSTYRYMFKDVRFVLPCGVTKE